MTARTLARTLAAACALAALAAHAGAGKKMHKEFVENNQLYPDQRWQKYVQDVGARLLAVSPDKGKEYHFHVLDGDTVNAFATGDAYIFVSRGLLAFIESEDQLAAVVGHEIGHVVARHIRKRRVTDIAGKSLGFVAAAATGRGELMNQVASPLTALIVSGYGREMELEADRLGSEYVARAGYNPDAVIDTVWVLKDQQTFAKKVSRESITYHGLFASHPKNDKRLHDAVAQARSAASPELTPPVGDFWALLDGLTFGDEVSTGLVKDETFYHGNLRIVVQFPKGWSVTAPQARARAVAPNGEAEGSITMARHEYVRRRSPEQYVTRVLKRDDIESGEELVINDNEAYLGVIDTSESDVKLQLIGVLYRNKDVFVFRGEAGTEGDGEKLREQLLATMRSLRGMTAQDIGLANNRRIEVIVAEPGQTYAALAKNSSLRQSPEETLRLLNADYPNGEPRAGDFIKVVR